MTDPLYKDTKNGDTKRLRFSFLRRFTGGKRKKGDNLHGRTLLISFYR